MNLFWSLAFGGCLMAAGMGLGYFLAYNHAAVALADIRAQQRDFMDQLFSLLRDTKLGGGELAVITQKKLELQERQMEYARLDRDSAATAARMRQRVPLDIENR